MNARFATATLFTAFSGIFTVQAADSQLLGLVMPDAKVLAGVNVDQAKASPFGLYVLTQVQITDPGMKQLIALTGFDPTRDVHEVLMATASTAKDQNPTGLLLARGNFDAGAIGTLAVSKGAVTETYGGMTIMEDPKKTFGLAFLSSSIAAAGDVASVKAAIDRPASGQTISPAIMTLANQWSGQEDAWIVSTVGAAALAPAQPAGAAANPAMNLLQQVQQFAGGVKFGSSVVGTASIQADNAADATQLSNTLQFLVNLAKMQSQNNADMTNLAQAVTVNTQNNTVKVSITLPEDQFQKLIQMHKSGMPHPAAKQ